MRSEVCRLLPFVLLILLTSVVWAADDSAGPERNVRVTIRVGQTEEGELSVKTYRMMVLDGGEQTNLMTGTRFPIPTTSFQASQPPREVVPMTSYTYQNVGFSAEVRAWVMTDGKVKLRANIESSRVGHDPSAGGRPLIVTRNQELQTMLTPGVPIEISRVESPNPGTSFFEIQADVLD